MQVDKQNLFLCRKNKVDEFNSDKIRLLATQHNPAHRSTRNSTDALLQWLQNETKEYSIVWVCINRQTDRQTDTFIEPICYRFFGKKRHVDSH